MTLPLAPVRLNPANPPLTEVQAVPYGTVVEHKGKWFIALHVQFRVEGGVNYGSFDMAMEVVSGEAWMIECSAFAHPHESFSGSKRQYFQAVQAEDGGWYLMQEGIEVPDPRFCLIKEKSDDSTTTV